MNVRLILSAFLFITYLLPAQTTIPAGSVAGTWKVSGSPYKIQGSILIPKDSTLRIEPGVKIEFQGHYKLLVMGNLQAIGTSASNIFFTAPDTVAGWYGIRFDNTTPDSDSSRISYCLLEWGVANSTTGADQYGGALLFNNFSKVSVTNCFIRKSSNFQIYCINSKPIIRGCNISFAGSGGGILLKGHATPVITGNLISYNKGIGIQCRLQNTDYVSIIGNMITHNSSTGIYCTKAGFRISENNISYNNISKGMAVGWYLV